MKHREFWIYSFSTGRTQVSTSKVTMSDEYFSEPNQTRGISPIEVNHVIEYSAYEELEAENARLREALEDQGKLVRRLSEMFKDDTKKVPNEVS